MNEAIDVIGWVTIVINLIWMIINFKVSRLLNKRWKNIERIQVAHKEILGCLGGENKWVT